MTAADLPQKSMQRQTRDRRIHHLKVVRLCLKSSDWTAAVTVFFTVLLLYGVTLAPTIVAGDAGELVTAAYELGVPHPPGYPLWTLLSHVAIWLGGTSVDAAYSVNVFSAMCGALACTLAYVLARRLGAGRFAAFGAACCSAHRVNSGLKV